MLTKAFNALASEGRASAFQAVAVRMVRDSAVALTEGARQFLKKILADVGFGVMREDAIIQWETQFSLTPPETATLAERQLAIESAWALTGAQGPGYLQSRLQAAGFDVVITENIPILDLTFGSGLTFSSDGPPTFSTDKAIACFGQNSEGYLLGNGRLHLSDGSRLDPIEVPLPSAGETVYAVDTEGNFLVDEDGDFIVASPVGTSALTFGGDPGLSPNFGTSTFGTGVNRWGYVFIVEGADGAKADVPAQKREAFETLLVQLKPSHLGALLRVNYV